jgi:AcrR family transcriptional regulator
MGARSPSLRVRRQRQTREEIVRVAFELFGKHGYESVSVEMIASAAGISRATFFNYFPQKELILREVAAARAEKLKTVLTEFVRGGHPARFEAVLGLVLKITEENARIGDGSKRLLLDAFFHQASQGLLLTAREKAVESLRQVIERIGGRKRAAARLAAETLFAVFLATMLEWLMREESPRQWLLETMSARLRLAWEGIA